MEVRESLNNIVCNCQGIILTPVRPSFLFPFPLRWNAFKSEFTLTPSPSTCASLALTDDGRFRCNAPCRCVLPCGMTSPEAAFNEANALRQITGQATKRPTRTESVDEKVKEKVRWECGKWNDVRAGSI